MAVLWEQLQRVNVMHVRGNPASGKTVLAALLQNYVKRQRPGMEVYMFTWPSQDLRMPNYYDLLNYMTKKPVAYSDYWLERQNTLIIIDEAQRSYKYFDFWDQFINHLTSDGGGPFVILFTSFGSAAGLPIEATEEEGSDPVLFRPDQMVSIRSLPYTNQKVSLYFNREEFNDAIARFCESQDGNRFIPSDDLIQYIWDFTNGHPGAARAVMEILIHSEVSINKFDNCAT